MRASIPVKSSFLEFESAVEMTDSATINETYHIKTNYCGNELNGCCREDADHKLGHKWGLIT